MCDSYSRQVSINSVCNDLLLCFVHSGVCFTNKAQLYNNYYYCTATYFISNHGNCAYGTDSSSDKIAFLSSPEVFLFVRAPFTVLVVVAPHLLPFTASEDDIRIEYEEFASPSLLW